MKNLQIRNIQDVDYFKALEWKARLHCESWECLLKKIFEKEELLEKLEKEEITNELVISGILASRALETKLDAREQEIYANGEDVPIKISELQ